MNVPFHHVRFGEAERQAVIDAMDSNWLSPRGPRVPEFGQRWADKVGARFGWPQSSGTGSLHVALLALGVGPGDKVAVPTYTCSPGVFPVSYVGATPVFVDCEPDLYGMDPWSLKRVLEVVRPKAAIPVHLYGASCRGEVIQLLREHNVLIIEDACESVGAKYIDVETHNLRLVGGLADIGCFSFRGDKVLTSLGTGGMTTTDSELLMTSIKSFTDLGLHNDQTMGRYRDLACLGFNYELSNPAAAFGLAQIDRLDEITSARRQVASWWRSRLHGLPGIKLMLDYDGHVYYQFPIWFSKLIGLQLDTLGEKLLARGVSFIPPFWPMHLQPQYVQRQAETIVTPLLVAEEAARHVLLFPCYPDLEEAQVDWLCEQILDAYMEVVDG